MKLIKQVVELGNGAAVYIPKEYKGQEVVIILPEGIENIKKNVINKLAEFMPKIVGIYLVGSYARKEQTEKSDIDVLVITEDINKKISEGEYEIMFVSRNAVEKQIEENALPIIPMLREAEVVINPMLIKEIRNSELTYKNIGFHINTTKSALKTIKEAIGLCRQSNCSDALAYSLALRFREAYIVECLIKDKMWSNKEFISLLKNISGSPKAYYGYLRVKNKEKELKELKIEEANKLYQYLEKKIKEQEKWALKRK
ncbi:nucleotidyltransferase domain-containing protein [Candidatus Pacearchaeota archaeon]|nr:nucleotidyltransferase domain-containing protein [Candidatus Pacearchaeota archaeon]